MTSCILKWPLYGPRKRAEIPLSPAAWASWRFVKAYLLQWDMFSSAFEPSPSRISRAKCATHSQTDTTNNSTSPTLTCARGNYKVTTFCLSGCLQVLNGTAPFRMIAMALVHKASLEPVSTKISKEVGSNRDAGKRAGLLPLLAKLVMATKTSVP